MKRIYGWILLALVLLASMGCMVGCGNIDTSDATPTPTATEAPTEAPKTEMTITNDFKILRSDESTYAVPAAKLVLNAIKEAYGYEITFETDFVGRKDTIDPNEKVILIGLTNRASSAEAHNGLKILDYSYQVLDEKTVLINGSSEETVLLAAQKFCEDAFGKTEGTTAIAKDLKIGMEYVYNATYPVSELTVCGADYKDVSVVYSTDTFKNMAQSVATRLSMLIGEQIPVVTEKKQTTAHAIRLKASKTNAVYSVYAENGDVIIEAPADSMQDAVDYFTSTYVKANDTNKLAIELPAEHYVCFALEDRTLGFSLQSREDSEVCPGVTLSKMLYKDRDGKDHVVFTVTALPGSVTLEMGLPDAANKLNGLATVYDQTVSAEQKLGYDIVASINADLFMFDTEQPNGTTVYKGKALKIDQAGYQGFYRMKDGSYYFETWGPNSVSRVANAELACGGRYVLMKEGQIIDNGEGDPFTTVHHPRTAFGYKEDGTLIFMVVDGRQSGYSDGATLLDLSKLFYTLGAYEAINLDGGGSTNLYVKNMQSGEHVLVNQPCETDPYRAVVNTLFFVRNKDYQGK